MDRTNELREQIMMGLATIESLRQYDAEEVRAVKADVGVSMRGRGASLLGQGIETRDGDEVFFETKANEGAENRVRTYVFSDETVDRMGDVIRVFPSKGGKGWLTANYASEPVFLWGHESWNPPIARSIRVWRTRNFVDEKAAAGAPARKALLGSVEFLGEEENPFAERVLRMVDKGALRAVSVGFKPLDAKDDHTDEEREKIGLGKYGVEFLTCDLLECSKAVVPANPNALITGLKSLVSSGEMSDREARAFAKVYALDEADFERRLREKVRSLVDFGRAAPREDSAERLRSLAAELDSEGLTGPDAIPYRGGVDATRTITWPSADGEDRSANVPAGIKEIPARVRPAKSATWRLEVGSEDEAVAWREANPHLEVRVRTPEPAPEPEGDDDEPAEDPGRIKAARDALASVAEVFEGGLETLSATIDLLDDPDDDGKSAPAASTVSLQARTIADLVAANARLTEELRRSNERAEQLTRQAAVPASRSGSPSGTPLSAGRDTSEDDGDVESALADALHKLRSGG